MGAKKTKDDVDRITQEDASNLKKPAAAELDPASEVPSEKSNNSAPPGVLPDLRSYFISKDKVDGGLVEAATLDDSIRVGEKADAAEAKTKQILVDASAVDLAAAVKESMAES